MSVLSSPYITTILQSPITISARQMDNNLYKHLKENLIKKLEGRCYNKYGFISKIYEILEHSTGEIVSENPMASAMFIVKFSCTLCHPMVKKQIICKIQKINKLFINATNGPITAIITMTRKNENIFYQDAKTNRLMAKLGEGKSVEVLPERFIKITVETKTFNNMDRIIMVMGELNDLATDQEIKKSFEDEYKHNNISFEKYIESNTPVNTAEKATITN